MFVVHTKEPIPAVAIDVTNGHISFMSAKVNRWLERLQFGCDQQRMEKRARRNLE